jgi:phage-related protein
MPFAIEYFNQKVLDEVESWPVELAAEYARLIELLTEHGSDLKLPHSKALGEGLFELRPKAANEIGRSLYCFLKGKRVVIVVAFIKKTQKTPDRELKLARKRVKKVNDAESKV